MDFFLFQAYLFRQRLDFLFNLDDLFLIGILLADVIHLKVNKLVILSLKVLNGFLWVSQLKNKPIDSFLLLQNLF